MLTTPLRRIVLTVHILASAGWAGAVAVFLVFALSGLSAPDRAAVAYPAMQVATVWVIQPLSFLAPATGLLLACGTRWGLIRHYWVLIKAVMILPASALLLLHTGPINHLAAAVLACPLPAAARSTQVQMAVDAGLALVVFILSAGLGVLKPVGVTPFAPRS